MLLDVRDGKGRTPCEVAVERGQCEMAELLLSAETAGLERDARRATA